MSHQFHSWQPASFLVLFSLAVLALSSCNSAIVLEATEPSPSLNSSPSSQSPTTPILDTATPEIVSQERLESLEYQVKVGDTLSSIALSFAISPQTLLWENYNLLFDNSDYLAENMSLLVLPTNGLMHQVGGTDTIQNIAAFFGADPQSIINWAGNEIDAQNPAVFSGQWLFIPGGQRSSRWREMPNIPKELAEIDPGEFGSGACLAAYTDGNVGDGGYTSPIDRFEILGESFSDWHPGLDLAVSSGEKIFAADDGVVVFSGWSNLGYGKLIMLDHGNGDYSLYSGLASMEAFCGQSVGQGELIARAAITAYSAGPILHFEIRRNTDFVDPQSLISFP